MHFFLGALRVNLSPTLFRTLKTGFQDVPEGIKTDSYGIAHTKNNIRQYGPKIAFLFIFSGFIQNYLMNMTDLTILNHRYKTIQLMITKNTQNIIGESFQDYTGIWGGGGGGVLYMRSPPQIHDLVGDIFAYVSK